MDAVSQRRERTRRICGHWDGPAAVMWWHWRLNHVTAGFTINIHLVIEALVLVPQALVLTLDNLQLVGGLVELAMRGLVRFTSIFQRLDILRCYAR